MGRIEKLLVANRGEIALRVMRTCRDMGIATVAVFSDVDAQAPFVTAANEAIRIGAAPSADSYLAVDRIVDAAARVNADAIHPGYGFLAENPELARACAERQILFVGPSPEAIRLLGSKVLSKTLVAQAGVPTIPTYEPDACEFPVLVKASAGGGGKGMRIVRRPDELAAALESARREAAAAFGDDTMLLERFVEGARHIEIQILADRHGNTVHLGERECSIQRRHQKVIEESPSPVLDDELREDIAAAAIAVARAAEYENAGTVEFILAPDRSFYFLEVNTRLQVEHPVTELVTGIDIVREQIRIAQGEPLELSQSDVRFAGAAIECRLYAEDPDCDFRPAIGTIAAWRPPASGPARIDAGIRTGSAVSIHYDPMLAKVICHGATRAEALQAMSHTLANTVLFGVDTNRDYLRRILDHPAFRRGDIDTSFLDAHAGDLARADPNRSAIELAAIAVTAAAHERRRSQRHLLPALEPGFRNNRFCDERVSYRLGDREIAVSYRNLGNRRLRFVVDGNAPLDVRIAESDDEQIRLEDGTGLMRPIPIASDDDHRYALVDGVAFTLIEQPRFPLRRAAAARGGCRAPMPGKVTQLMVQGGATVAQGDTLLTLEAMKMEHPVTCPHDGIIERLCVAVGDQVDADALLVVVTPNDR